MVNGGDNDDEYATLACKWSVDGTAVSTVTLHLKVAFFDQPADERRTVLRAIAFVVSDAAAGPDVNGPVESVYEGTVRWEDAVETVTDRGKSDDVESVRVWLRDARMALTGGNVDDDADDSEGYEYCLQRAGFDDEVPPSVVLTWKMKLGPFGMVMQGSVTLVMVTEPAECARRASAVFVRPLIDRVSAERTIRERAVDEVTDSARCLLEDNKRLLDRLRLLVEMKKRDERQLMERFVRVLNAKKVRLTTIQQQLSELKRQCDEAPVVAVEMSSADPAKMARDREKRGGRKRSRSIVSFEEDERMEDSVDIPHGITHEPETVEGVILSPSPKVSSVPVNIDVFAADTQIDDVTMDDSNPWFQQQRPVSPSTSVQPLQSLPTNEDNQKPKHMTALDKLWSGIL